MAGNDSLFPNVRCTACDNIWANDTGVCESCGSHQWRPLTDQEMRATQALSVTEAHPDLANHAPYLRGLLYALAADVLNLTARKA